MKMTDIIFVSEEKDREKRILRSVRIFETTDSSLPVEDLAIDLTDTKKIELVLEDGTVYPFYKVV